MCNIITQSSIYLPLEIRENILRFCGKNFLLVMSGILGGEDLYHNYYSILERLTTKTSTTIICNKWIIGQIRLPCGNLHSNKQPAQVIFEKGIKKSEWWYIFGELRVKGKDSMNNDYPCSTSFHPNGQIKALGWYKGGAYHRNNELPAHIEYRKNHLNIDVRGVVKTEIWYVDGKIHRNNDNIEPAYKSYYKNGNKKQENWYIRGENIQNQKDEFLNSKPSSIKYYESGRKSSCVFINNTIYVNDNDVIPPLIVYYEDVD